MLILTDQEYKKKMEELGFIEDPDYEKYFLGDMAFLMNIDDNVNELGDLIQFNSNNHPTYMSQVLMEFSSRGGKLVIGPGAIDEHGVKLKKALYCLNYKELYPKKNIILEERNKIERRKNKNWKLLLKSCHLDISNLVFNIKFFIL